MSPLIKLLLTEETGNQFKWSGQTGNIFFLSFLATSCLYSVVSLGKWSFWKEFNFILFSICFRILCIKLIDEKAQAVWVGSIEKTFKLAAYPVTHFIPLIFFYTSWKRWKTSGYLMFSGSIERDYWYEMD